MLKLLGEEYKLPHFSASTFRQLRKMGVPSLSKNPYHFVVGVVALAADVTLAEAADMIRQHIQAGGDVTAIIEQVTEAVDSFTAKVMQRSGKGRKKLQEAIKGW